MSYLKLASSLSLQKLMVCAWFARQEMPFQQADLPIQRSVEEVVRSSVNLVSYDSRRKRWLNTLSGGRDLGHANSNEDDRNDLLTKPPTYSCVRLENRWARG